MDGHAFDPDKAILPVILYQDGTAALFGIFAASEDDGIYFSTDTADYNSGYEAFESHIKRYNENADAKSRSFAHWGAFRMQSDTIRIQVVVGRPLDIVLPIAEFEEFEYEGILLSDATFALGQTGATYQFRPFANVQKLDSTNWLKTDRRFQ